MQAAVEQLVGDASPVGAGDDDVDADLKFFINCRHRFFDGSDMPISPQTDRLNLICRIFLLSTKEVIMIEKDLTETSQLKFKET